MSTDIIPLAANFWNVRGSYKFRGILEIGTQASLVRRANGKFVFLDSYTLSAAARAAVDALTSGGKDVEAIVNLHPFHTVHVTAMHRAFPSARLYGTARHLSLFADLPWEQTKCEDPAMHALFAEDFEFSAPRGVDFISADESVHTSSVLLLHRASRTLHVDDTFVYFPFPWPLRLLVPGGLVRIHPMLPKALQRRAGAASDFRRWAAEFTESCRDVEHLCAAHSAVLSNTGTPGTSVPALLRKALDKAEPILRAHENKYG